MTRRRKYGKRAGQFVREEMRRVGRGAHVRTSKQAIAVGLSRARRAGVRVPRVNAVPLPPQMDRLVQLVSYEGGRFLDADIARLSKRERDEVDAYLVAIQHPLAFRPGTQESRIAELARQLSRVPLANPAVLVFGNPPQSSRPWDRATVISQRAVAIEYDHVTDGKYYRHEFQRGVVVEALVDGSVRLYRPDGKPIWRMFNR